MRFPVKSLFLGYWLYCYGVRRAVWSRRSLAHTLHKPLLGSSVEVELSRQHKACIIRLRLRTCSLTHQHYFTGSPPTSCQSCSSVMTLQYLLIDCLSFATARIPLLTACRKLQLPEHMHSLLSTDFPAPYSSHTCKPRPALTRYNGYPQPC